MTVSEVSDRILDDNFGLELSHSEGIDSTPSDIIMGENEPDSADTLTTLEHNTSNPINESDESNSLDHQESSFIDESNSLDHYGILGMRWGVRRSKEELGHKTRKRRLRDRQYEDETPQQHQARLQRESNERAIKTQSKALEKSEKRQLKSEADKQKRLLKSQEKQQKRTLASQEKVRQDQMRQQERQRKEQEKIRDKKSSSKRQDPKSMTDQELRDAIARVQLEKQYKKMTGNALSKTTNAAVEVFGGAGKKILTALVVTYGTRAATKLIDEQLNKKKKGGAS